MMQIEEEYKLLFRKVLDDQERKFGKIDPVEAHTEVFNFMGKEFNRIMKLFKKRAGFKGE